MKTIRVKFPAKLTDQKDYTDLLERENIQCLKDPDGYAIYSFADLVDGMVHTAGPGKLKHKVHF